MSFLSGMLTEIPRRGVSPLLRFFLFPASAEPTAEQKLDACLSSHFALTFIRVNDGFKKSAAELIAADERSLSEKFKEALTEDLEMNLLQVFRV